VRPSSRLACAVLLSAPVVVASCGDHATCGDFCHTAQPILVLQVTGGLIPSVSSSCGNARLFLADSFNLDVLADPLLQPETCHIDILVSDGRRFSFDIPFTQRTVLDCSTCTEGYTASWQALFIIIPPTEFDGSFPPESDAATE